MNASSSVATVAGIFKAMVVAGLLVSSSAVGFAQSRAVSTPRPAAPLIDGSPPRQVPEVLDPIGAVRAAVSISMILLDETIIEPGASTDHRHTLLGFGVTAEFNSFAHLGNGQRLEFAVEFGYVHAEKFMDVPLILAPIAGTDQLDIVRAVPAGRFWFSDGFAVSLGLDYRFIEASIIETGGNEAMRSVAHKFLLAPGIVFTPVDDPTNRLDILADWLIDLDGRLDLFRAEGRLSLGIIVISLGARAMPLPDTTRAGTTIATKFVLDLTTTMGLTWKW